MPYKTMTISPLDLMLDYKNPRFIVPPNATQEHIIEYLLEFEEVHELAKSINENGGLMLGERLIVVKENDIYIVLEGNRRACACKLLLNRALIPKKYENKIPFANPTTLSNIEKIEVDIADTRESAQSALAAKHIDGIKKWSTLSKQKFFVNLFDNGKSVKEISEITGISETKVKKGIIENKLLNYAFALPNWTEEEKDKYLNIQKIKPHPFLRVFGTTSKIIQKKTREILKLSYDNLFEPISELPKDIFDEAIHLIAKAAFIDESFNTRKTIDDVPGFINFINSYYDKVSKENQSNITSEVNNDSTSSHVQTLNVNSRISDMGANTKIIVEKKIDIQNTHTQTNIQKADDNKTSLQVKNNNLSKDDRPKPSVFFEDLTWNDLDPNNPENSGLISIAEEIVSISKNNYYKKFPISATILMRGLLEQSMIYYLKKKALYQNLLKGSNGKTPALEKIIKYFINNKSNIFNNDKNFERTFTSFAENPGTKDYLDMVIHNPHLVKANADILDKIAAAGLKGFICIILNK
ncbi:ParB/Srx family N-terminal domain-containing protein [Caloramator australicus]|uniref:ParB/Sulfiredoxin domain-containing protein n=1 Tax=Caloramator australicus RC3 TaxID=857293 RepID=I7LID5_9CLOT|nr:ParB/Srx family N-terminal domain-containing protein [Caloramator australicus]CCJ32847.1 hypothetical protein CAAU_0763 [Caloramator australicus RC3]